MTKIVLKLNTYIHDQQNKSQRVQQRSNRPLDLVACEQLENVAQPPRQAKEFSQNNYVRRR